MAAGPRHSPSLYLETPPKGEEISDTRVMMIKRIQEVWGGGLGKGRHQQRVLKDKKQTRNIIGYSAQGSQLGPPNPEARWRCSAKLLVRWKGYLGQKQELY